MPLMTRPASEARLAILFVTGGALTLVWSSVWMLAQYNDGWTEADSRYLSTGALLSGGVLTLIGLGLGRLARAARQAELPPPEIIDAEARIAHAAAGRAPIVTPVGLGGVVATPANGSALERPVSPVS